MTYVVAVKHEKVVTLISDTLATDRFSLRKDPFAVKTGILFSGCIYGLSGHAGNATSFIRAARNSISYDEGGWTEFGKFIANYGFPDGGDPDGLDDSFSVLLSSRHSGEPEIYSISSRDRHLVKKEEQLVSIGSGKDLLDSELSNMLCSNSKMSPASLLKAGILLPNDIGHCYSQFLMNYLRGTEGPRFEDYRVGGVFNSIFQNEQLEYRQRPAVYIRYYIDRRNDEIRCWSTRVSFPNHETMLLFENDAPGNRWTWHTAAHLSDNPCYHPPVVDPTTIPELVRILENEENVLMTSISPSDLSAEKNSGGYFGLPQDGQTLWDWRTGDVTEDADELFTSFKDMNFESLRNYKPL